jgi:hypothetical protein
MELMRAENVETNKFKGVTKINACNNFKSIEILLCFFAIRQQLRGHGLSGENYATKLSRAYLTLWLCW